MIVPNSTNISRSFIFFLVFSGKPKLLSFLFLKKEKMEIRAVKTKSMLPKLSAVSYNGSR